jgi:hypothetical protein
MKIRFLRVRNIIARKDNKIYFKLSLPLSQVLMSVVMFVPGMLNWMCYSGTEEQKVSLFLMYIRQNNRCDVTQSCIVVHFLATCFVCTVSTLCFL